jgi:hypothetical protein
MMTLTSQTQTSTNFISQLAAVLDDTDVSTVALFFTLGLMASIYFAIHLPTAVSLTGQFP